MEDEANMMQDLVRTLSELSLHVAINSIIFTSSSSSNRDVTTSGYDVQVSNSWKFPWVPWDSHENGNQ